MSADRDGNGDEGPTDMNYPSPGHDAMVAGPFYHTAARDDTQEPEQQPEHQSEQQPEQQPEHQSEHQPEQQPEQQVADHLHGHVSEHVPEHVQVKQDHEHIQHHVQDHVQEHHEMNPPEPATPQQHVSRPPNLEELQLAAQLGHGLSGTPMMQAPDPNMNVEDPNLRSIMPQPEPEHQHEHQHELQQHQQHEHQQHEHQQHEHQQHEHQQLDNQQQELQHEVQHEHQLEHQQTPSYIQDTPTSDSMVTHGLQVPVGQTLQAHYLGDAIPPRKRSKVSRACDECRRKKIKCDAPSDTGDAPCSSCARSSIRCLFSRVPQKRGPSKGYIKELADRIHSIENKLESEGGLTHEDLSGIFGSTDRSRNSAGGDDISKKRPYSSISGGEFGSPAVARPGAWVMEARPIQPTSAPPENHSVMPYSADSLAPQPTAIPEDATTSKPPVAAMDISMADVEQLPDIDDEVLQDYLATVQTLYPILPSNIDRLHMLLAECPPTIKSAFSNALLAVAQSSSGNVRLASFLLDEWENNDTPSTQVINIVHIQTLLLLIIDADWRCSPSLPSLLARAVALANTMRLWKYSSIQVPSDPDTDHNLCIRSWWSLVLMDGWHAVGMGKPTLIPATSIVAPPGLETLIGDVCFQLTRMSKLLGRVASLISFSTEGNAGFPARLLNDYIDDFRQGLPVHIEPATHPLVHLAYWHCKLTITLLAPAEHLSTVFWPLRELINLLSLNADIRSPLSNHFGSLVALVLGKLCKIDAARDEALQLNRDLLEKPGAVWDSIRDKLLDQARPTSSGDAGSLQHLADLATAHQNIIEENGNGWSLGQGYLQLS